MDEQREQPLKGFNLVCADDEPIALTILAEILNSAGATVRTANDGLLALEIIRTHPTDAVLVDIQMPVMDGITLIKTLRAEGFGSPILAVSAASKHEAESILASGANHYISKPVITTELIETLVSDLRANARTPHTQPPDVE